MSVFVTPKRAPLPFRETLDAFVEAGKIDQRTATMLLHYHGEVVRHSVDAGRMALAASIRHAMEETIEREVS